MEVFILLTLILINGLFAMSEIAIVTAKRNRLAMQASRGSRAAKAALQLAEHPTQFLSTVQIGITSIGIMSGIFGESALAAPFADWLQNLGMAESISDNFATALVVITVTYLSIVIGELVPKRLGQNIAEPVACAVARPMQLIARIARPFVLVLSHSTSLVLRLMGIQQSTSHLVTEEDIHALLEEGSSLGVLDQQEHKMLKNVLRLEQRSVVALMVHHSDIVFLDTSLTPAENYQRVLDSPHSHFPVCEDGLDNLLGLVSAKDLLKNILEEKEIALATLVTPCHMVPETLNGMALLDFFRTSQCQMVFVVDEYGDIKGLVTLQDLLEALTGEFVTTEDTTDAYVVVRADGSLLLDGYLSILELADALGIAELPVRGHFETLSGLLMSVLDKLPTTGDSITLADWKLEIVDMDGRRIDKVLACRQDDKPTADNGENGK